VTEPSGPTIPLGDPSDGTAIHVSSSDATIPLPAGASTDPEGAKPAAGADATVRIDWMSAVEPGGPAGKAVTALRAHRRRPLRKRAGGNWEVPLFPLPGRTTDADGDPLASLEYGATEKLGHG